MKTIFANLPIEARRSVTFDNGPEFHEHQQLKGLLSIELIFVIPIHHGKKAVKQMKMLALISSTVALQN